MAIGTIPRMQEILTAWIGSFRPPRIGFSAKWPRNMSGPAKREAGHKPSGNDRSYNTGCCVGNLHRFRRHRISINSAIKRSYKNQRLCSARKERLLLTTRRKISSQIGRKEAILFVKLALIMIFNTPRQV